MSQWNKLGGTAPAAQGIYHRHNRLFAQALLHHNLHVTSGGYLVRGGSALSPMIACLLVRGGSALSPLVARLLRRVCVQINLICLK